MGGSVATNTVVLVEIRECKTTKELTKIRDKYNIDENDELHSYLMDKWNKIRALERGMHNENL